MENCLSLVLAIDSAAVHCGASPIVGTCEVQQYVAYECQATGCVRSSCCITPLHLLRTSGTGCATIEIVLYPHHLDLITLISV